MYLGLDLGTSGLKGVLIDGDQRALAQADAPLRVQRPHPGWSEQLPADWIAAASQVLDEIAAAHPLDGLRGIGLSGQMHGATLLDARNDVLRPCILWNDTRAHAEAEQMDADARFRAITGNIVFPGFTAPKLRWVQRHEPEVFARTARVLLPKDYLRLWLTGEAIGEMSDASGTAWFDPAARDWSDDLLAACDLDRAHMPDLVEGDAQGGALREDLARRWSIPRGIPVAGGGDNAAAGVGLGVVRPGQAFVSLGTSGVLFAATDSYAPAPETAVHSFCHALGGRWHQMGVILSATDALEWYARLVGADAADLTADLGPVQAPGSALFLPYLGGERTPHNDARVRGALLGLDHATDQAGGTRAVMQGVAFALRDCADALAATGTRIERLIATGGGSRSEHWLQMIANTLGVAVDLPQAGEHGAAFGAARLAMMAAGQGADIATPPAIARSFDPDAALRPAFDEAHLRFRAAYQALAPLAQAS